MYNGRSYIDRKTKNNNAWTREELIAEASKLGYKGLSNKTKEQVGDILSGKTQIKLSSNIGSMMMPALPSMSKIPSVSSSMLPSFTSQIQPILSPIKSPIKILQPPSIVPSIIPSIVPSIVPQIQPQLSENIVLPSVPTSDLFVIGRERNRPEEIKEAKLILDNLIWLKTIYPQAINKWRSSLTIKCSNLEKIHPEIRTICEDKDRITNLLNSMITWMNQYILVRERDLEPSEDQLKEMLDLLTSFTIITSFFEDKMRFFSSKTQQNNAYKAILAEIIIKLIGCREAIYFFLASLFSRMKNITSYDQERIDYLLNRCRQLRIASLKI